MSKEQSRATRSVNSHVFRKSLTRLNPLGPAAIPAWSIVVIAGLGMLAAGGGLYLLLKKTIIDGSGESGSSSYHPTMQDEV